MTLAIPKTGVHWFRHDLRLHDNQALSFCQDDVERFIPIFIFDGETAGTDICGYNRFRFLLQSLADLERQFNEFNINFMCFYGKPHEIIDTLIKDWNVQLLSFSKDTELRMNKRDKLVHDVCHENNVQVIETVSHTLYDPKDLFDLNNDSTTTSLEQFRLFCSTVGCPEKAIPAPNFKHSNLLSAKNAGIYVEQEHKVPGLERFNKSPECVQQEKCLFPGKFYNFGLIISL